MKYLNSVLFKSKFLVVIFLGFYTSYSSAQFGAETEWNFSLSDIEESRLRFSGFSFIMPKYYNLGRGNFLRAGISLRNTGLIQNDSVKIKARAWGLGIPVSYSRLLKNNGFIGGGVAYELYFHYKEKVFLDDKLKEREFFSNKINPHQIFTFIEYTTPHKSSIRLGIYLTDFFNKDYVTQSDDFLDSSVFAENSRILFLSFRTSIFSGGDED